MVCLKSQRLAYHLTSCWTCSRYVLILSWEAQQSASGMSEVLWAKSLGPACFLGMHPTMITCIPI